MTTARTAGTIEWLKTAALDGNQVDPAEVLESLLLALGLPAQDEELRTILVENEPMEATEFKKADDGKPRPDLTPVELLIEMGKVMKHGADKYGADNWKKCEDPKRYEAAIARHWLAYLSGEELDPDSGLSHLAHCACSLGMLFGVIVENAKGKV